MTVDGQGAVRIGRIAGVPIEVDVRGVARLNAVNCGLVLLLCAVANPYLSWHDSLMAAAAVTALLQVSAVVHELAHLCVAVRAGQIVQALVLNGFGGYILVDTAVAAASPLRGALYVGAGPVASLGLWLGLAALAGEVRGIHPLAGFTLAIASALNFALLVLNLLPIQPLDGGRLLAMANIAWQRRRPRPMEA